MVDNAEIRRLHGRLEPCHSFIYFSADAGLAYAALGLDGGQGYFASRSAPMGPVGPEMVTATFYNFKYSVVEAAVPSAWSVASPEAILDARTNAAEATLRTCLGDLADHPDIATITELVGRAALAARPEGRALFAAHAGLEWPDQPLQRWWHVITLMREFRGDAHVAALMLEGINGTEAVVTHVADGSARLPRSLMQATRGWTDEEWADASERLRSRGILGEGETLTEAGAALREHIETMTDRASAQPWEALTDDEMAWLTEAVRPFAKQIMKTIFGR